MTPSSRPQYHLDLGALPQLTQPHTRSESSTAASSPIDQPLIGSSRLPSSTENGTIPGLSNTTTPVRRGNTGSPSNEQTGSRPLFPRRARELQAEGSSRSLWGPPISSGLSTPLVENIPESPGDDTFPDLKSEPLGPQRASSFRQSRSRAGTAPSSAFPPIGIPSTAPAAPGASRSSNTSPFRTASSSFSAGVGRSNSGASLTAKSALLSRIRAGSLPQKSSLLTGSSPFGPSIFSTNWIANRDRANTYSGQADPSSPSSAFQRDFSDTDVKTLDYLGLVDHGSTVDNFGISNYMANPYPSSASAVHPLIANLASANRNRDQRFRSYSVNAKEKYAADEDDASGYDQYSGTITPSAAAVALAETQAEIYKHNLEVQAFANQASASRPRARTVGVIDGGGTWRNPGSFPSRMNDNIAVARMGVDSNDYAGLTDAVQAMQIHGSSRAAATHDVEVFSEATSSLWLGGIPASTTSSSLKAIFEPFGRIESARVLTQKSCGFVNYETTDSAIQARAHYNGKELFPGGAPVRIGYARAPSNTGTPGGPHHNASPSPDPFMQRDPTKSSSNFASSLSRTRATSGAAERTDLIPLRAEDLRTRILEIVKELGATYEEKTEVAATVERALFHGEYEFEIPPVPEPSHVRVFDAPRLREIRKRVDNNSYSPLEMEEIAMAMLPEVAELSNDYLGNTLVQKLYDFCSDHVKLAMLQELAPHMAETSAHRNGTWAAQKVIECSRRPVQMDLIVLHMRPYATALLNDQYANYAVQGCLKFGFPHNNFVLETMLSQLWPIAQGRFGARAMRACLESPDSTRPQQLMMAAAIALHSVQLATNTNGALLLTWLLDTASFPNRRKALVPQLISELVRLCTHKIAHATVLKIINQRNEPEARDMLLQALFFSKDDTLEQIVRDQANGSLLVFKVITTPFFDEDIRGSILDNVRQVLTKIKAQPSQGYKRLMDEVNMPTRGSSNWDSSARESSRPRSAYDQDRSYSSNSPFNSVQGRNGSADSSMGYEQYNPAMLPTSVSMSPQNQMQYNQTMISAGRVPFTFNPATAGFAAPGMASRPGMSNNSYQGPPVGYQPQPAFNGNNWQQQQQYVGAGGYAMSPQQQPMMGGGGQRGRR